MTQGMSVAVALSSGSMQASMNSSAMKMEMAADMPCMDMMDSMDMSDDAPPMKCPSKCCDGKVCLDMSSCAHAQPALAAVFMPMMYFSVEHKSPETQVSIAAVRPPTSLLRPPISFHS